MSGFTVYRKSGNQTISSSQLADAFSFDSPQQERWMFVVPHDDDAVLGGGLLFQKAKEENIPVTVFITTDGAMGYCNIEHKNNIAEIRKEETLQSFRALGMDDVHWLDFPDCDLPLHGGRRWAKEDSPCVIEGCTGLQNAYTYYLRKIKPTRIFVASEADLNIDHKMVYQELLMSLFHASGNVWPELGETLPWVPKVYEMAIYCDFPQPPNIKIAGQTEHLDKKIEAIRAYQSQEQIEALVENVREGGSVEYFRDLDFHFYSPKKYEGLF